MAKKEYLKTQHSWWCVAELDVRYEQILRHPYDVIYNNSDVSIDNIDKIALLTGMHLDDDKRIGACLYKLLFESQSCY